jgi:hypothetical protein
MILAFSFFPIAVGLLHLEGVLKARWARALVFLTLGLEAAVWITRHFGY